MFTPSGRTSVRSVSMFAVIGACLLCSGCSEESDAAEGPYADAAREALRQATSEFERQVFEDLTVTRAEYEEAVTGYVACVEDAGGKVTPVDQSGYYSYRISGDISAYDDVADRCAIGTKLLIEPFYVNLVRNPENRNFLEIVAECFVRHEGVAIDNDLTGADVEHYLEVSTAGEPLPFEVDPEIFDLCMSNPQN